MKYILALILATFASQSLAENVVTIVAFNAENLFDTEDDLDNPHDNTFLPLSVKELDKAAHDAACEARYTRFYRKQCKELDWSADVYHTKLKRYADVLRAMPALPEVIIIAETENRTVLDDLVSRELSGAGYSVVQLDTSDEPESRGIDVGILTLLPLDGEPSAHPVDFGKDSEMCGKSRDILEARVTLPNGEPLTIFGVHFPSGRSPFRCRIRAMLTLKKLSASLPADSLKVAGGDFNVNCVEAGSDAYERLLFRSDWYASPELLSGCAAPGSSKFTDGLLESWNTWSFLDQILISKELSPSRPSASSWFADLGSFQTMVVHPEQVSIDEGGKGYIEPKRFDPETGHGVSDHWPVALRLVRRR